MNVRGGRQAGGGATCHGHRIEADGFTRDTADLRIDHPVLSLQEDDRLRCRAVGLLAAAFAGSSLAAAPHYRAGFDGERLSDVYEDTPLHDVRVSTSPNPISASYVTDGEKVSVD